VAFVVADDEDGVAEVENCAIVAVALVTVEALEATLHRKEEYKESVGVLIRR
jgi:hypothetical protein